jgi:hypothetical protein
VLPKPTPTRSGDEAFLGYRIRKIGDVFIAVPLEWARGRGETLVAADLKTLRREIERWWYEVGP